MRHTSSMLTGILVAVAIWLGPLGSHCEASNRYGYRTTSYRAYRSRPSPQVRHYSHPLYRYYRPYYRHRVYYRPHYYYGSWYRPSWGFWAWPFYWPSFGFRFGYVSAPRIYAGGATDYSYRNGAVQTKVQPRETEVYVDGHYAGTVDDFDGMFQRLYLPPGQHEIRLTLDGYRTHRQELLINSGRTYKIHHKMQPLGAGETTEPLPKPDEDRPRAERPEPGEGVNRDEEARAPREPERRPHRVSAPSRFGMLSLRIQPQEAQIVIDEQLWGTSEGLEELVIHLLAGHHTIEIRLEGFEPFAAEIEIREGQTTPLNVKLNGTGS